MTKYLAIAMGVLLVALGVTGWLLLDAHEALGQAKLTAQINADTIEVLRDQDKRNQAIDAKLEQLAQARAAATREVIREVYRAPSTDACRNSPAMRALDGRLQYRPGDPDGRTAAAPAAAQPVPASGR